LQGIARPVAAVFVVAALIVGLGAIWVQPSSASVSSWSATTNYPAGIESQSCVVSSGFVYCIGGATTSSGAFTPTNAVYFALLSSSGVGSWSETTSYPTTIFRHSCVVNSGFVYCIAGQSPSGVTNATYFAALSSSGVGSWSASTKYPRAVYGQSCVVDSGVVYCIGGYNSSTGSIDAVYFASLSSSGVGSWSATTNYSTTIQDQSCVASAGFVYCVGGTAVPCCLSNPNAVYFAPLSSTGVGVWSASTNYPTTVYGQSCVVDSGFAYCIGGFAQVASNAVYFAPLSSSGVDVWSATTSYPTTIFAQSCVANSGFVYCIGGTSTSSNNFTNAVYFARFVTEGVTETTISCSPSSIAYNQPSQCTATVTDSSASPTSPSGTVTFSVIVNTQGYFTPSNTCALLSNGPSTASCAVNVTWPAPRPGYGGAEGSQPVSAIYSGDATHHASSGNTTVIVTRRSTSTMVSCSKMKGNIICNVNVTDISPATPVTLTGTVAMNGTGTGTFTECNLSTTGSTATCTANYFPGKGKAMIITITATYSGDPDHLGSSGSTTIKSS